MDQEQYTCLSSYFQMYGTRRLLSGNAEKALFLIYTFIRKGDREDPGNFRDITLLIVVRKVFYKILNYRLVQCLNKGTLHEAHAGWL